MSLNIDNVGGGATETISVGTLTNNTFYRLKLCFSYVPSLTQTAGLRARAWIDDGDAVELLVLSNDDNYPVGVADIYMGTATSDAVAYDLNVEWVSVTHRGVGSDSVLGI